MITVPLTMITVPLTVRSYNDNVGSHS